MKCMHILTNKSFFHRDVSDFRQSIMTRSQEPSALEIAAEQMRLLPNMDSVKQRVSYNSTADSIRMLFTC